jgi:hypothetical protein
MDVNQPVRGADRNRDLARSVDRSSEEFLLPSLEGGITLLDVEGSRGVPVLHSLVIDHLLLSDGPAFWVDANGHATTTSLAQLSPSRRLLNRIHVARGFTPYQHFGAVCDLPTAVNRTIRSSTGTDSGRHDQRRSDRDPESSRHTPSLIVAPALDTLYRADDTLADTHADTLLARVLARLRDYGASYDVPVLVTRTDDDGFTDAIARVADHHLQCEQTKMGPRFVGDEFETLVYPVDDGAYYQTTFAYWREILETRAEAVGLQPTPTQNQRDSDEVGSGITTDGSSTTMTADPLLDAWTAVAGPGGR